MGHQGYQQALKRNYEQSIQNIVDAANQLAEEKHFFHWPLEFPEVFNPESNNYELRTTNYELKRGFDCVLGNPPWERIKLQEKEFFASQSPEIANAVNKAAREKLQQFEIKPTTKIVSFKNAKKKIIERWQHIPLTCDRRY